jgi:membrane protein implicated in regulation of membrane protease activity
MFNFLWQMLIFLLLLYIAHTVWSYTQENVLKKPSQLMNAKQIEKYEHMIHELQQQKEEERANVQLPSSSSDPEQDLGTFVEGLL